MLFVFAFDLGNDAALFLKAELLSGCAENLYAASLSSTVVSILLADASTFVIVPHHIFRACFHDASFVFGGPLFVVTAVDLPAISSRLAEVVAFHADAFSQVIVPLLALSTASDIVRVKDASLSVVVPHLTNFAVDGNASFTVDPLVAWALAAALGPQPDLALDWADRCLATFEVFGVLPPSATVDGLALVFLPVPPEASHADASLLVAGIDHLRWAFKEVVGIFNASGGSGVVQATGTAIDLYARIVIIVPVE